jgi:acyl-CoA thioesterase
MQELLRRLRGLDETMMPFGKTIGFTVEHIASDEAVVRVRCMPHLNNVLGYMHGGAIFTIADTAIGLAHLASLDKGETATTVESRITYMRPALEGLLRATARVVKPGRTLSFYKCDITDDADKLMARVSATMMTLNEEQSRGRNTLHRAELVQTLGAV